MCSGKANKGRKPQWRPMSQDKNITLELTVYQAAAVRQSLFTDTMRYKNYFIDPDDLLFSAKVTPTKRQTTIGVVEPKGYTYDPECCPKRVNEIRQIIVSLDNLILANNFMINDEDIEEE
jgi:hypothetical protein